jgi:hypothetical protein
MGGVTAEKGRPVTGSGGVSDIGGQRSRPGSRRAPITGSSGSDMSGFVEKMANGRWRVRYRGPDGRERSKTFDRRVDADRWLAGVSFAIARGEWTDPARSRVTVGDWSRQWLTAKAPSLKATTRESYRSTLKTCIWPTWERVPLAAVTHSDVAAWAARLSAQMRASRCRKSAILLSGIMSAAVRDQRISGNPCDGVSPPRLPDHRQRFLTMAGAPGPGGSRRCVPADDPDARPIRAAIRRVCRTLRSLGRSDAASASGVRVGVRDQWGT